MSDLLSYPLLSIQYDALCIRLAALIITQPEPASLQLHLKLIHDVLEKALAFNHKLDEIYTCSGVHLKSQQDSLRLQREKLYFFKNQPVEKPVESNGNPAAHLAKASKKFRTETGIWNQLRQLLARTWRFFLNLPAVLVAAGQNAEDFTTGLNQAGLGVRPIMNYLSWLFLLPRLLVNLFEFAQHLFQPQGLEKKLSWWMRFKFQFQERWFELANDALWVPGGLLCCFLLTGSLAYAGVILTIALFLWDVLTAGIRATRELYQLHQLIDAEKAKLSACSAASSLEHTEQENYTKTLEKHQRYERQRHLNSLISSIVVTICSALALSLFVVAPWAALLASGLLMLTSVVVYVLGTHVIKRPANPLMDIKLPKSILAVPRPLATSSQPPPLLPLEIAQPSFTLSSTYSLPEGTPTRDTPSPFESCHKNP